MLEIVEIRDKSREYQHSRTRSKQTWHKIYRSIFSKV